MTIGADVTSALSAVLSNTWADELPEKPNWPAIAFEIDTEPESTWVQGARYYQHTVTIFIYAKTKAAITAAGGLQSQVDTAMQGLNVYLQEGDRGSAAYEADPSVYAYYSTHVIRQRELY